MCKMKYYLLMTFFIAACIRLFAQQQPDLIHYVNTLQVPTQNLN
jgi:hypothetical protein